MPDAIVLEQVHKTFGNTVAVNHLSLDIAEGELVAILGPSGCGKTTTLRMIAGFEQPDSGRVFLYGKDITCVPAHKRNIGMMFQNYALFPHLNIFENIAFGLQERGVRPKEIADRVSTILDLVRLSGFEKRRIQQLSGGESQRIALARALVVEPLILLMDEPLGALDRKLREEMQLELKEMLNRLKLTSVFVTHDQEEALTMSNRVAVMNKGNLEQVGQPADIYECPDTQFCASFLGLSNIFTGEPLQEGKINFLRLPSGLRLECQMFFPGAQPAAVMIRPEKVVLGKPGSLSGSNCSDGKVLNLRYLGAQVEYHIQLESGEHVVARRQTTEGMLDWNAGLPVAIQLPVSCIRTLRS